MAYHLNKRRKKKIRLARTRDLALLLLLADQKGLFFDEKVEIDFIDIPFARKGLELLLEGKVDMTLLVESNFAYLGYSNSKQPIKAFASLEKRSADNILIRRAGSRPQDIRGCTVGFTPRTTSHTFLVQFLKHHGIDKRDISLKPFTPQAMPNAFIRGECDAASVWHPHCNHTIQAAQELDIPFTHIPNDGFYKSEATIAASKGFLVKNRVLVGKFIKGLERAEEYMAENIQESQHILAGAMRISMADMNIIAHQYHPKLQPIDTEYLENIDIIAKWIAENDTEFKGASYPNYLDYIDNSYLLDLRKKNE